MRPSFVVAVVGLPALASSLFFCEVLRAEPTCDRTQDHVTVSFVGNWTEDVKRAALSDLAAALEPKRMGVCPDERERGTSASVSFVRVELLDPGRVRIEVDDSLTDKLVSRAIQVDDSTESSSALIVAVAVDELLRATWAELSIKRQKLQERPAPSSESERETQSQERVNPSFGELPSHRIALGGAVDAYVVGSVLFGANVVYGSAIGDAIEWDAFAGPRVVRAKNASELGQVRADALAMGLRLRAPLMRTSRFFFGPVLGVAATHAWFRGRATTDAQVAATDEEFQGWAVTGRVGLDARLHLGSAFVSAGTSVGFPLLALAVTDGTEVVGGMTGLEWSNGLSLGWWWQ